MFRVMVDEVINYSGQYMGDLKEIGVVIRGTKVVKDGD